MKVFKAKDNSKLTLTVGRQAVLDMNKKGFGNLIYQLIVQELGTLITNK
jgi:hypothetical protein